MELKALEGTGPNYSMEKLLDARRRTTEAVLRIAEKIKPDMLEEDARRVGEETLEQLGSTQRWHKTLVDSVVIPPRTTLSLFNRTCAWATTISSSSYRADLGRHGGRRRRNFRLSASKPISTRSAARLTSPESSRRFVANGWLRKSPEGALLLCRQGRRRFGGWNS